MPRSPVKQRPSKARVNSGGSGKFVDKKLEMREILGFWRFWFFDSEGRKSKVELIFHRNMPAKTKLHSTSPIQRDEKNFHFETFEILICLISTPDGPLGWPKAQFWADSEVLGSLIWRVLKSSSSSKIKFQRLRILPSIMSGLKERLISLQVRMHMSSLHQFRKVMYKL